MRNIGRPAVPALITLLAEGNEGGRRQSVLALEAMGATASEAIPALEAARDSDPNQKVRCGAWKALAFMDPTIPRLLGAIRSRCSFRGADAIRALKRNDRDPEELIPTLERILSGEDAVEPETHRYTTAALLAAIGEPAVPALHEALGHADPKVRRSAAHAIGGVGTAARPAIPTLEGLLDDPDPYIRRAAARSLASLRKPPRK